MRVYVIKYAESTLQESLIFDGGNPNKNRPISFAVYLVTDGDRKILVDTGCETMPGFVMSDFVTPVSVLESLGFSAEEITDVIITHAHHDHIHAIGYYKNATVHITEAEYQNGKGYIPKDMTVHTFEGEYFLTPSVTVIEWGGHSKGSAIVEILIDDLTVVLAGDECYTNENIEKQIPTGTFHNKQKAKSFVEEFSKDGYEVHTCHDISLKTEKVIL